MSVKWVPYTTTLYKVLFEGELLMSVILHGRKRKRRSNYLTPCIFELIFISEYAVNQQKSGKLNYFVTITPQHPFTFQ